MWLIYKINTVLMMYVLVTQVGCRTTCI